MAALPKRFAVPVVASLQRITLPVSGWSNTHQSARAALPLLAQKRYSSDIPVAYTRGGGGRSSFNGHVVTVFGGSGFLGRYVCSQLGKSGAQVIVTYRGEPYDVAHLKLVGDLGQVLFAPFHLQDEESLRSVMKHSDIIVNCIGRDFETRNFSFDDVHNVGAARIARIAAEMGVKKLVHVSTLNASLNPQETVLGKQSMFSKSKMAGEMAVKRHFPEAVIMRPSDMWGEEDRFFQYWGSPWRRHFNSLPLWRGGEETVKQPVSVVDVAEGIVKAALDKDTNGAVFECVGSNGYYLCDMLEYFYEEMRYGPIKIIPPIPTFLAKVKITEKIFPAAPPLIFETLLRESATDVLTGCPTLEDLGVKLTPMEDAARYYLKVLRRARYYQESLGEIPKALPPVTAAEVDTSRKVYY